ncbi:MAG: hypothetical protein K1X88_28925 [Nannocystaceae bacterium]|nr:hypothetical protein [Nannocystaceae bacterium]
MGRRSPSLALRAALRLGVPLGALAPAAAAAAPAPAASCPDEPRATLQLGSATAPLQLSVFLDPANATALTSWTELQRIVAEREGQLGVAVWFVRPLQAFDPRSDRVRRFALAATRLGATRGALAQVARHGVEATAVALGDPPRRDALAQALGLEPAALAKALADPCDGDRLDLASGRVLELARASTLGMLRLPALALGSFVFDDSPQLDRVRPELGREPVRAALRWRADVEPPPPLEPRPRVERLRVPPRGGLSLGGPGLPHRLVVMAQGEDDPNLFLTLPRALQYRASAPRSLTIHVLARGRSFVATQLRQRLCAARRLGRDLEYARVLAASPDVRREPDVATVELLRALDGVDETACADEPDPAEAGLPEGTWLDGQPRSATELEDIAGLLRQADRATRALSPWMPRPRDD